MGFRDSYETDPLTGEPIVPPVKVDPDTFKTVKPATPIKRDRLRFYLKGGASFVVECTNYTIKHKDLQCVGYDLEGMNPNTRVMMLDVREVAAVIVEYDSDAP